MSELLRQVYASAPGDVVRHLTLELLHATFPEGAHRFVRGYDDLVATREDGQQVSFEASGIAVIPPRRGTQQQPSLGFRLDNVTLEVSQAIEAALEAGGLISVIYREYLSNDLSAPANSPATLYALNGRGDRTSVTINAGFRDAVNTQWPRRRYTVDLAPGLKYL